MKDPIYELTPRLRVLIRAHILMANILCMTPTSRLRRPCQRHRYVRKSEATNNRPQLRIDRAIMSSLLKQSDDAQQHIHSLNDLVHARTTSTMCGA